MTDPPPASRHPTSIFKVWAMLNLQQLCRKAGVVRVIYEFYDIRKIMLLVIVNLLHCSYNNTEGKNKTSINSSKYNLYSE